MRKASQNFLRTMVNRAGRLWGPAKHAPIPENAVAEDEVVYRPSDASQKSKPLAAQAIGGTLLTLSGKLYSLSDRSAKSRNRKKKKKGRISCIGSIVFWVVFAGLALASFIQRQSAAAAPEQSAIPKSTQVTQATQSSQTGTISQAPPGAIEPFIQFPCSTQIVHTDMPIPVPYVPFAVMYPITANDDTQALKNDWLSGDTGHFVHTDPFQTNKPEYISSLVGYSQMLGLLLITPIIIMIGYQFMLGATGFRYAGAIQGASRLLIGILAVAVCIYLIRLFIDLANGLNDVIVHIHTALPYPQLPSPQGYYMGYTLEGDTGGSYRGLVMPVIRWGCAGNDFVKITSTKFWGDIVGSIIPGLGGLTQLILKVASALDLIHNFGEFMVAILSISIAVQVFMRIIFLNFYIVTSPIAFSCWALPGGVGQNVVKNWLKGFFSILFLQSAQLFVITVAPLVMPTLPNYNDLPFDNWHILSGIFAQLPPILVLVMTLRVPTMLGSSAAKSIAAAGTVAGGAVGAIGMAVYKMV